MAATRTDIACTTLRWKLLAMAAVLIVGITALLLVLMRDAAWGVVRGSEIERIRQGPVAELKQRCTDYLTDRDRQAVEKLMASLVAKHKEIAYICFVDSDLSGDGLLSSASAPADELLALTRTAAAADPNGQPCRIGGEAVLDITEPTPTKPSYMLHVGLRTAVIREHMRGLFSGITATAAIIAAVAFALAFGMIIIAVGPLEKLAADATRLSLGDMRVTFRPRGHGEIGRLADALDRLKESVLCALRRSGRKQHTEK